MHIIQRICQIFFDENRRKQEVLGGYRSYYERIGDIFHPMRRQMCGIFINFVAK